MSPSAVLDVRRLQVAYAGNRAVDLDSLSVAPGEIVGVVGANGAPSARSGSAASASMDGRRITASAPAWCWCPKDAWCLRA